MRNGNRKFGEKIVETIRRQRTLFVCICAMVVFVTTYLLILPAITLDKDTAKEQGGIDLPKAEQVQDVDQAKDADKSSADVEDKAASEDVDKTAPEEQSTGGLSYEGDGYTIEAAYDAKAGLPEDTSLEASEIGSDDEDYDAWHDEALKAVQEAKGGERVTDLEFAKFYDISLMADGQEVEPDAPVDISISYDKALKAADADHVRIIHFGTDENGDLVPEVLDPDDVDLDLKKGKMNGTAFAAESFSVYGVVYTVDFAWEVDGKEYEFSLPGGGFISLGELLEALKVVEDDSEAFITEVETAEFSDPDLVWVGQAEDTTTVGELKEANELDCQYSEELTEEEIAEINAKTVDAGDWALISLKPFDTEETLTVTMKNGDKFEVRVTDAQENPYGLDGKTFAITAYKNNTNYYMKNEGSSSNSSCLIAYTYSPSDWGTPQGSNWTFEWTGEGKKYLIHDDNNRYILIENDKISLTDKNTALANPITVISREGKYSFVNEKNNQALNIYGSSGFGRWAYNETNSDFLMTLQNPSNLKNPGTISTADTSGLLQINLFDYGPENELDKEANNNTNPYNGGINSGHTLKFFSYGKNVGTGINDFTGAGNGPQTGIVADQLSGDYPVLASNTSESLDYLFGGKSNSYVTPYTGLNYLFTKDENGYYHYDSDQNYAYLNGSNFEVYSKTFPEEGADEQYFGVGFFPFNDYNEYYNCIHGKNFGGWHGDDGAKEGHYNHHFGMSLTGNFIMPPGGKYNGQDVSFEFSGDDDMWVYVDGILIMDIGGIHNPVHGEINFTTGEVTVHGVAQENFKEKYKRLTGKDWDDSDFSNHDFRVFYMERGGMYSNLEVTFNLPLTEKKETGNFEFDKVSSKNESLKLPDATFGLFTDSECKEPFTLATVPVNATSDKNGVVSFKNIPYGTYYMKETVYPDGYTTKNPEEYFAVTVGAAGTTITSSSGANVTKVTNNPKTIDVEVEKLWKNGETTIDPPAGASVEIVLGRYKLVEDPNAPGTATLVIKDSYTGLPSGSSYHVTYTITGPDGYSKTITKAYTDSSKQIEETVEVPAAVAGSQYTVTKQVQNISYHNINNQNQTVNVTVAKNGTGQTQFDQSSFTRNAYRVRIYAVNSTDPNNLYSENYYPAGSNLSVRIDHNAYNWGFFSFTVSSNTGWNSNTYTSDSQQQFTSNLNQDIDLVLHCSDQNWTKGYDWIKDPYITGATPVRAASTGRMMMSMQRGAPAQTMTQNASAPTLPDPPQNTLYELDADYAANPDKITLSGGTWSGKAEGLDAYNEYGPYVYYVAAVNETGVPEGTVITIADEVTLDGASGVLTVTNNVPSGYLQINKSVTYNGVAPANSEQKEALAGTYNFGVYTDENCTVPYKTPQGNNLTLTITIDNDGVAKSSQVVELLVGNYWIKEENPSQTGVTPEENHIPVVVTKDTTTTDPAIASFTNNKVEDKNPDEMAIDIEKTFKGLSNANKIPPNFHPILTYYVPGSNDPVNVELGDTQGNVVRTKSNDGLTWHWHVIQIPTNAERFAISEENYDIAGYTRVTTFNGSSTPVEHPDVPQAVTVLVPEIELTEVTTTSDYTTPDNNKAFYVTDNQILLVRMTNHATVIVSQKSLSKATRTAIENLLDGNGGKVPGDNSPQAKWSDNYVYFSKEVHGNSFSYGGRTIYYGDDNVVEIPHNASSHEVRATVEYAEGSAAENSITIQNSYSDTPIELDIVKKEKDSDPVKYLPGAEFTITKLNEADGSIETKADGETPVFQTSQTTSSDESSKGRLTFTRLYRGIYEIQETGAPAGYILDSDVTLYIRVEDGQVTWVEKSQGQGGTITWTAKNPGTSENGITFAEAIPATADDPAVNATFTVPNTPGAELPSSGGPGTTWIYLIGSILLICCGTLLVARRRTWYKS